MKRNEIIIPIILLICCLITSCSERSTNPPVVEELNDIASPPCRWINVLEINSKGDFFAATSDGLFHSTDNGSSWSLITFPFFGFNDINELKIASNDYIYLPYYSINASYLFHSTDNGNTWTLYEAAGWISSIEEDQYGNIYFCESGLYKSSDEGGSWQRIYQGGVDDVCIPNDTMLLIGVRGGYFTGHLEYSTDMGSNWHNTSYNVTVLEFYNYNSIIFVGGMWGDEGGGGIHKSTDGGISWQLCGFGLNSVTSFVTSNQNKLFIGTDVGIYFTADNAVTWQNVLSDSFVTTLMRDSKDFLYAGTNHGSFLRSTDNGMTWQN
jgi:photosystem II stability/assembly factor-like uncharacterized protein